MPELTVCVVGLGYVGLPTAALLSSKGARVHGVEVNQGILDAVASGRSFAEEPGLEALVGEAVAKGFLTASQEPAEADVFMLCLPTPLRGGHQPDLAYVETGTKAIAPVLRPGNLVILESTSPVGATGLVGAWLRQARPDLAVAPLDGAAPEARAAEVCVAYGPERVLPGNILEELTNNDRVVGGLDPASTGRAIDFYRSFVSGTVVGTDARTAEMCKLVENAFRDTNIAFANELSMVCDRLGLDVFEVISIANRHPRVSVLKPGPGVGGHCVAVDPWFLVSAAPDLAKLMRTAREVNDQKPYHVLDRIRDASSSLRQPVTACLGLSFKADVDDLRESPAAKIVAELAREGSGRVLAVEPHLRDLPSDLAALGVTLCDIDTALKQADVVVLLVDHTAFRSVDASALDGKVVIDTRGLWRTGAEAPSRG